MMILSESDSPMGQGQGCIFRLTCSHPELTEDHVLTSVYVKFLEPSREMPKIRVFEGKKIVFDFP